MPKTALIAVGGNSLIRSGQAGTMEQQWSNARKTAAAIVSLLKQGYSLVVTHGNGPQVGAELLRSERSADQVYTHSLDVCDACTQGEIGYVLSQCLRNAIAQAGLAIPVATIITQVVVDPNDPAMKRPSKPVGPAYTEDQAKQRTALYGWKMVREANRGYRRTVPSPAPIDIVEYDTIRELMARGTLVVAAGGGGIPVVRTPEGFHGVDAVIDKDRASALLAWMLYVETFIISTDTDCVYLDHGTLMQRPLHHVTSDELEHYQRDGQFPAGNMGPKIESALAFLRGGGKRVVITCYEQLSEAMRGNAGTEITPGVNALPEFEPAAAGTTK